MYDEEHGAIPTCSRQMPKINGAEPAGKANGLLRNRNFLNGLSGRSQETVIDAA
jgi:hypothetical protein